MLGDICQGALRGARNISFAPCFQCNLPPSKSSFPILQRSLITATKGGNCERTDAARVCGLLQYDYFDDDPLAVIFQKLYFFGK